uniref:Uncharacterized protein MANES_10G071500 n=1 Tax=Rhizophora mucronata TaxID=61149 RepID=A0A2P2KGI1_RHIMU
MESILSINGPPEPWHFLAALCLAFGFVAARFLLDRFIFRVLAIWLVRTKATPKLDEATRATIVKCRESMWKLMYYGAVELFVLKITYNEPWFRDTGAYFKGWPDQELKIPLKLFYMCQCGFYIYSIAALLTWETRRKDFSVMMSHHVITVVLIGFSYITRFFRVGSIVLALHDASDVFMEAAKIFKYSGSELGASICFGLFAISWLMLRLIFFPIWVIKSTRFFLSVIYLLFLHLVCYQDCLSFLVFLSYSSIDFLNVLDASKVYDRSLYYLFNTMLLMLLVFHIYWWVLICYMIRRQLGNRGKVGEDIRSDSEDDE